MIQGEQCPAFMEFVSRSKGLTLNHNTITVPIYICIWNDGNRYRSRFASTKFATFTAPVRMPTISRILHILLRTTPAVRISAMYFAYQQW